MLDSFYVVVPEDGRRPTVAETTAGQDGDGNAAVSSGSFAISDGGVTVQHVVTSGILAATVYDVWVTNTDVHGNLQLVSKFAQVTTLNDRTPPVFSTGYPDVQTVYDFAFVLEVALDEPGVVHWIVVVAGTAPPTSGQILNGTDGTGAAALVSNSTVVSMAGTVVPLVVSEALLAATDYDVWIVAEDDEPLPNLQVNATSLNVTTGPDVTPPRVGFGFPTTANVEDFAFDVVVGMDEPGSFSWVILTSGSPAPTAAAVVVRLRQRVPQNLGLWRCVAVCLTPDGALGRPERMALGKWVLLLGQRTTLALVPRSLLVWRRGCQRLQRMTCGLLFATMNQRRTSLHPPQTRL